MDNNKQKDKLRGSLVGGAVGDALGYPVEFMNSYEAIQKRFGQNGITRLDTSHWWVIKEDRKDEATPKAWISDDTQMTLFTANGICIGTFVVDGKVTSLNSYLTPDSEYYELNGSAHNNRWLADVDGSYGSNDTGIFFFTPDGKYVEWTGEYLYSDIPFDISETLLGGTK